MTMSAPDIVVQLIQRFQSQLPDYRAGRYNETQLRRDYLDPFFEALGWDMTNRKNYSEKYREVVQEVSVEVEGQAKAADYAFQSGGGILFFLEAKKPAVNIETNPEPAYQIRRYAWSAKVPISLLSDFEQLAVYDCREKPALSDPASKFRVNLYSYRDYAEKWDEIYDLFSHQAVHQGSLDRYAVSLKGKRGTADVDDDFLAEMERWRADLARNIALRNPGLTTRDINFAVQMTIDRLIFLRICEDRGIEPENALRDATDGKDVYGDLLVLFNQADRKYNSGLFHFAVEKGQSSHPDTLTPTLRIDDKVFKDILANLYYPKSPYAFKYIPIDLLGQVYERFLGKVIRLTAGHQARVEEKPEVRKAGGVYYTPTYIVDYIVKNTVGELLKGKDPESLKSASLCVLDPACGSGSFLLGAYQYLLDWYLDWYVQHDPARWSRGKNPAILESRDTWQLTMEKKKEILTSHIYGVDIDPQAVEVTKLSLLLKVVENPGQLSWMSERILPDLGRNIQCGNSLIGPDYYDGVQGSLFDSEEQYRVNAFDWQAAFPQVFRDGGFDAVIGNPPYVYGRDWSSLGISDDTKLYLRRKFSSSSYQMDMFSLFMEQASNITKPYGLIGQIVPNVWLTNTYSSTTRKFILSQSAKLKILKPINKVFANITVDTIIYSLQKTNTPTEKFFIVSLNPETGEQSISNQLNVSDYIDGTKPISTNIAVDFVYRLKNDFKPLNEYAKITRGVHPYRVGGYGKSAFGNSKQTKRDVDERPYNNKIKLPGYRNFIYGKDLKRFAPPIAHDYIKYGIWLAEPRKPEFFEGLRIYSRKILSDRLVVTVETLDSIADQQVYITYPTKDFPNAYYLAGVLGSRVISFYIRNFYDEVDANFPQIKVSQLGDLPIPISSQPRYERMVWLVETMLDLHKQLAAAQRPDHKEQLDRQIAATDRQIDALVYELYGLTDEEIKIVAGEG